MITVITDTLTENGKHRKILKGLHADTKPTIGMGNTSKFIAMDSGKTWFFDEAASLWKVEKFAEWRCAIANAPVLNNDIGDSLYDPNTTIVYMWDGTEFAEQFAMEEA